MSWVRIPLLSTHYWAAVPQVCSALPATESNLVQSLLPQVERAIRPSDLSQTLSYDNTINEPEGIFEFKCYVRKLGVAIWHHCKDWSCFIHYQWTMSAVQVPRNTFQGGVFYLISQKSDNAVYINQGLRWHHHLWRIPIQTNNNVLVYFTYLQDRVQNLNMSLTESNSTINELQERLQQLQRALTSSEHDRRVLQERLDTTR